MKHTRLLFTLSALLFTQSCLAMDAASLDQKIAELTTRISRLQSEIFTLRTQLNRLERQRAALPNPKKDAVDRIYSIFSNKLSPEETQNVAQQIATSGFIPDTSDLAGLVASLETGWQKYYRNNQAAIDADIERIEILRKAGIKLRYE